MYFYGPEERGQLKTQLPAVLSLQMDHCLFNISLLAELDCCLFIKLASGP